MTLAGAPTAPGRTKPLVGVLASNRTLDGRRTQAVASRFVVPLTDIAGVTVLIVPAIADAVDPVALSAILDGLLLPGCCSNVAVSRYRAGAAVPCDDAGRDDVALRLADAMIGAGRPVFGICRGMQELNVLFGGTLSDVPGETGHYRDGAEDDVPALFDHHHDIDIAEGGMLAAAIGAGRHRVNSVHRQGINRLGAGLSIEARAPDDLVEAVSARPCGAPVLGVQWHPEWDVDQSPAGRAFFELLARAVRGDPLTV
ncbi:gamma-glutamyl-gamma-aminobutyrate hydrolase family protein [Sphingomonas abietis]|uniref:Gamma-glutamyl-gamma-aminobutyrate hydrolase family protein n=1 Tax=Sphingomonas abietis TaxID=3012344 RepID=A0ABY7NTH5_9SPHN|nr:gamma-glutamyl-gamma-aminobutyrate hydrolase family protein [Sphingomonas abietis]WBO23746.1 gamma-glutamyl-gamma-aminobutyrate hydrolase family protein [Sphingomonas abietis]